MKTTATLNQKDCGQCGQAYLPKTDRSNYCSEKCQQRAKYARNPYNKDTFGSGTTANRGRTQTPEHVRRRAEALAETLAKTRRRCIKCETEYTPTLAAQKYCSGMCWNAVARLKKERKQPVKIHADHYAELFRLQQGKCRICSSESGSNGRGDKLAVDHCHSTGHIRGLLCHKCNTALGLMKDDVGRLQSAIDYLTEAASRHA